MQNVLFSRRIVAIDADRFKRVEYQTIKSNDGKSAHLHGAALTGIAINPNISQQPADGQKESVMRIEELVNALNNLSAAEKTQVIGALSATQHSGPLSALDRLLAKASSPGHAAHIRATYAAAQRAGITVPPDGRLLQVSEVDKQLKEASQSQLTGNPEARMRLKIDLATAGIME